MSLQKLLVDKLSDGVPWSARELSTLVCCPKKEVNSQLYALLQLGAVNKTTAIPPLWSIPITEKVPVEQPDSVPGGRIVLVDLGNVHDCLQELSPYAARRECKVFAFADRAFNGYGITPPADAGIVVHQTTSVHRNAADLALIWTVAELVHQATGPLEFIVVTKDQGFHSLVDHVGNEHSMIFVKGWEELRDLIE